MKKILTILALAALTVPAKAQLQEFSLPGQEYRPHVRMWIPVAANDEGDLRDQIKDLAKAGFGDVEIVAFDADRSGGRGPQAAQHPPRIPVDKYGWGTAAWTNTMKTVLDECGKNGMKATFTLGPAWPVASPLLEKDSPGVEIQLACTRYDLEGGSFTGEYPEDAFAVVA